MGRSAPPTVLEQQSPQMAQDNQARRLRAGGREIISEYTVTSQNLGLTLRYRCQLRIWAFEYSSPNIGGTR